MTLISKILMGVLVLCSVILFYLAAKVLTANQSWREAVVKYEERIEAAEAQTDLLQRGDEASRLAAIDLEEGQLPGGESGKPGVAQLRVALHDILADRGRVWRDVRRGQVNPATGEMSVSVDDPFPHQIKDKMVVYLFEQPDFGDEPATFLGEFQVTGVAEATVALQSTMQPTEREQQRLSAARDPLTITEIMPVDRHAVFRDLDDDELRNLLPAETVEEYILHGQEAPAGTPAERIVDGKYQRRLRDYAAIIHDAHYEMSKIQDQIVARSTDLQLWTNAVAALNQQIETQQTILGQVEQDLGETRGELEVVQKRAESLRQKLADTEQKVQQLMEENKQLAEQWSARQLGTEQMTALPATP